MNRYRVRGSITYYVDTYVQAETKETAEELAETVFFLAEVEDDHYVTYEVEIDGVEII